MAKRRRKLGKTRKSMGKNTPYYKAGDLLIFKNLPSNPLSLAMTSVRCKSFNKEVARRSDSGNPMLFSEFNGCAALVERGRNGWFNLKILDYGYRWIGVFSENYENSHLEKIEYVFPDVEDLLEHWS